MGVRGDRGEDCSSFLPIAPYITFDISGFWAVGLVSGSSALHLLVLDSFYRVLGTSGPIYPPCSASGSRPVHLRMQANVSYLRTAHRVQMLPRRISLSLAGSRFQFLTQTQGSCLVSCYLIGCGCRTGDAGRHWCRRRMTRTLRSLSSLSWLSGPFLLLARADGTSSDVCPDRTAVASLTCASP